MSTYVKITGVEAITAAFNTLPVEVQMDCEKTTLRRAAGLVASAAQSIAPRATGLFAESHGVVVRRYEDTGYVLAVVGSRRMSRFKGRANIAHLIESGFRVGKGGTFARTSGRTAAKSSITGARGEGIATRFIPGKRVMERAFLSTQNQVQAEIAAGIGRAVNRIMKKAAG